MANYYLSNAAKADLKRIYSYGYQAFGETQADTYFAAFFDTFERIAQAPLSFPSVNDIRPGYRRAVCGVDSIYFRQNGDMVEIMAILGGQQSELWL